ncbi:hypothetical protein [Ralstonia edaphi]|uniref:hypothetical protein n=1 Tax=Ralstonia edaphi TaxID=3058599 RepID=UPI00292E8985|nr:hypothetical protein [Ralstonia sp. LMG 6871]
MSENHRFATAELPAMENMNHVLGALAQSELLRIAATNVVADYGSDVPLTVLYGGLGRHLARQFNTLPAQEKTQACDAIEKEMTSRDSRRVELVATGLLEALFNASRAQSVWEEVEQCLGPRSRQYLSDWAEWKSR